MVGAATSQRAKRGDVLNFVSRVRASMKEHALIGEGAGSGVGGEGGGMEEGGGVEEVGEGGGAGGQEGQAHVHPTPQTPNPTHEPPNP